MCSARIAAKLNSYIISAVCLVKAKRPAPGAFSNLSRITTLRRQRSSKSITKKTANASAPAREMGRFLIMEKTHEALALMATDIVRKVETCVMRSLTFFDTNTFSVRRQAGGDTVWFDLFLEEKQLGRYLITPEPTAKYGVRFTLNWFVEGMEKQRRAIIDLVESEVAKLNDSDIPRQHPERQIRQKRVVFLKRSGLTQAEIVEALSYWSLSTIKRDLKEAGEVKKRTDKPK
jgi:hypothetical protein